jgi:hypothetical protein
VTDKGGFALTSTLTGSSSARKLFIINWWRRGELNPFAPIQTALFDVDHQSKLILRAIEWRLLGLVLSQIVTQNLGTKVSVR